MDLKMYDIGYDNEVLGVDTMVQVAGMAHRGRPNMMDLTVKEVLI